MLVLEEQGSLISLILLAIKEKCDLDSYMLQFKRYATVANWPQANWATQLCALLRGNVLYVYSRLSQEDTLDYGYLKMAIIPYLQYNYTLQNSCTANVLKKLNQRILKTQICLLYTLRIILPVSKVV